jgi:hypothetical protein
MLNFADAKSILESVTELVKRAATIDLQEKIVSLREFIISIKDENISLKEENQALKLQLSTEHDFKLRDGLYWKEGEDVPFCQKCLDGSKKRVHLQHWSEGWKCFECDHYYAPHGQAGRAQILRPSSRPPNDWIF